MTKADRWLLPDGMDELLPIRAAAVESLRLALLSCYRAWGYQLVRPPLVEFLESLKVGTGQDLALQTFTLTDQVSGRLLGVRADLTPQVARMDAHSLKQEGPSRLCYCAPVLHSTSGELSDSRELDQIGIELFGSDSIDADLEVIELMLLTVEKAGALNDDKIVKLDLGHVAIYRAIAQFAELDTELEAQLSEIIQRKAMVELDTFITENLQDNEAAELIRKLPSLCGGSEVLSRARDVFKVLSDSLAVQKLESALLELETVQKHVSEISPHIACYFDLGEVRGYDYHTGLVFAVYKEGYAQALAKGGRYDSIGESFGRSRPASGFSSDLRKLLCLSEPIPLASAILIPARSDQNAEESEALKEKVQELRGQGEVLVQSLGDDSAALKAESCSKQLVFHKGAWEIQVI